MQDMYGRLCGRVGDWRGGVSCECGSKDHWVLLRATDWESGYGELRNGSEAQSDMPCNPSS